MAYVFPSRYPSTRMLLLNTAFAVAGLLLIFRAHHTARHRPEPMAFAAAPAPAPLDIDAFMTGVVDPQLAEFQRRNTEAAQRAVDSLQDAFDDYRVGVPPFTRDITSWGTRFGIIGRMSSDQWDRWWHRDDNADRVQSYVEEKFDQHILSEAQLRADLENCIARYHHELSANRNAMLSGIDTAMRSSQLPVGVWLDPVQLDSFSSEVDQQAAQLVDAMGRDSVSVMVLSNLGGEVAGFAATRMALAGAGRLAVMAASAGGATASGAGIGSTGGTLVTPGVGTVVGLGVGIVVGALVDGWMTGQFEEELQGECSAFIDELERYAVNGGVAGSGWYGMRHVFHESSVIAERSIRGAVVQTLTQALP